MSNKDVEMSYYGLYLRAYFEDFPGSGDMDDDDFIESRSEQAAEEYEDKNGPVRVRQAHEGAITLLLSGIAYE